MEKSAFIIAAAFGCFLGSGSAEANNVTIANNDTIAIDLKCDRDDLDCIALTVPQLLQGVMETMRKQYANGDEEALKHVCIGWICGHCGINSAGVACEISHHYGSCWGSWGADGPKGGCNLYD